MPSAGSITTTFVIATSSASSGAMLAAHELPVAHRLRRSRWPARCRARCRRPRPRRGDRCRRAARGRPPSGRRSTRSRSGSGPSRPEDLELDLGAGIDADRRSRRERRPCPLADPRAGTRAPRSRGRAGSASRCRRETGRRSGCESSRAAMPSRRGPGRRRESAPPVSIRHQPLERHEPAAVAEGRLDLVRRLEQLGDARAGVGRAQEPVDRPRGPPRSTRRGVPVRAPCRPRARPHRDG